MHLQVGAGLVSRRGRIVAGVGPVRGSDLDQTRPRLAQHVRHPESTTDLDGFSARDHDLLTGRHRRQHQKHRRGAVVHDQRRLRPGQRPQQPGDLAHATAALVALPVDLQRHRVGGRGAHRLGGLRAHRRATEIGVDDDAGGIEDGSEARSLQCADGVDDASLDLRPVERFAGEECLAHDFELGARGTSQRILGQLAAEPFRLGHDRRDRGYRPQSLVTGGMAVALTLGSLGDRIAARGGIEVGHRRRIRNNENGSGAEPLPVRSGREDLNLRPQRPERCALTGLRYSPHRSKIP